MVYKKEKETKHKKLTRANTVKVEMIKIKNNKQINCEKFYYLKLFLI